MSNLKLMLIRPAFTLLFLLFSIASEAAVGCRIGNVVYTSQYQGANATVIITAITYGNFYNTTTLSTQAPACPRAGNVSPSTGLINLCVLNGSLLSAGTLVNYDRLDPPVQCDLDDYTLPFAAAAGTLGLLVIRRRRHN
ncbi:hypothetical protein [Pedobacter sp. CFBP9032]|uniref:hypothetical protein n=1 Tax=Pedobacter sp. CFBP9032 TaxID=3096539 RepID=UPI002A6B21A3|nr:hypothetical protein [Pedobacter sp. CFBP9032]MDY0907430.1 hypothetical protein [Pedobacter sp. CFBP9032]